MLEDILWAVVPEETRSAEEVKAVSVLANGAAGGATQTMPLPSFLNRDELDVVSKQVVQSLEG